MVFFCVCGEWEAVGLLGLLLCVSLCVFSLTEIKDL